MKKIFALVLITVLTVSSLVSCADFLNKGNSACKDGHSFTTYTSNNDATCTEDGTLTAKCDNCDVTDTKMDEGTKKAHAFGEWKEIKTASCKQNGIERRFCSVCNASEERTVTQIAHSYNTETFGYQDKDGHAHRCTVCGEHDALVAHTPGAAATETDAQICTDCGFVIAPPTGHIACSFVLETVSEPALKSVATCTVAAVYYKSCACGSVSTNENDTFSHGSPLGHDLGEWYVFKPSTVSEQGEKRQDCKRCDHYEKEIIPAKESNMDPNGWTPVKK